MGGLGITLFFLLAFVALTWSLLNVERSHRDPQEIADRQFAKTRRF